MGDELAAAYNRQEDIDAEEAVVKSQFKERRASVEQAIGQLSRNLANQFEMRNVECTLEYDHPNAFEVSYFRKDTSELVKTRPMTEDEREAHRQKDLPLTEDGAEASAEESVANAEEFFGKRGDAPKPGDVVVAEPPAEKEAVPLSEAQQVAAAKKALELK